MTYKLAPLAERYRRLLDFVRPVDQVPAYLDMEDWALTTLGVERLKAGCWQRSLVVNSKDEVLGFVCGAGKHQYGVGCSITRDACPVARKWDQQKKRCRPRKPNRRQIKLEEMVA